MREVASERGLVRTLLRGLALSMVVAHGAGRTDRAVVRLVEFLRVTREVAEDHGEGRFKAEAGSGGGAGWGPLTVGFPRPSALSSFPEGNERRGDQWGWAVDYETADAAQSTALRECGAGCSPGAEAPRG